MTIDEAIKILDLMGVDIKFWKDDEGFKALKLGIEALKCEKGRRGNYPWHVFPHFPGETEEVKHVKDS